MIKKLMFIFLFFTSCSQFLLGEKPSSLKVEEFDFHKQKIHMVEFHPRFFKLELVEAHNQAAMNLNEFAEINHGLVAFNAGFFDKENRPVMAYKKEGKWKSFPSSKNRGHIGWNDSSTEFLFDRLTMRENEVFPQYMKENRGPWNLIDNILGGTPLLFVNDSPDLKWEEEGTYSHFLNMKFARTALCQTKDGTLKIFVVDGNSTTDLLQIEKTKDYEKLKGLTIKELADFLRSKECVNAINLDGGQSSGLYFQDHFIVKNKRLLPFAFVILKRV